MQVAKSSPPMASIQPQVAVKAEAAWLGWLFAILASTCFSLAPPVARGAILAGIDATTLLVLRMGLATLAFLITILAMKPALFRVSRQTLIVTFCGGTMNGLGMLLFFWALVRVDASVSSMMISTVPLVVLSLLALRGERFTYRHIVRLALGLGGIYLLLGPGGDIDPVGILLLVIAIFCFAVQITLLQWYLKGQDPRAVSFYISLFMLAVIVVYWLTQDILWRDPGQRGWLSIIVLALVSTFVARLLFVSAVDRIGSGQMSLLSPLETLQTITWSMLFLGERLTVLQLVGGALVLGSALLALRRLDLAKWRPRWRNWTRV
ncbi:MAG TPA: DMT family transporter [Caldilineaceae bacterium]|nr:DMT family transporter [Caldilineaceae bacterium]